jgi:uncharacterized secreted protein with C-terminal beta-propeller domain
MRVRIAAVVIVAMTLAACTVANEEGARPAPVVPPGSLMLASALIPFDACDDLLDYVTEHVLEMVGPYGLDGFMGGVMFGRATDDSAVAQEGAADGGAAPVSGQAAGGDLQEGTDFSGTNVQEAGVDEPDVVKTDGRVLYTAENGRLVAVDVTGDEPRLLSDTPLEGEAWGQELLLHADRLLVLGTSWEARGLADRGVATDAAIMPVGGQYATLTLYDVSDPSSPEQLSSLVIDGRVLSARMTGGVARVVTRSEPVGLPFVTPEGQGLQAEREATRRNREIVRDSTAENWIPYFMHTTAGGRESEGTLLECSDVSHPEEFAGLGLLAVNSVDLSGDLRPTGRATGVLAGGETVYASPERLYVATNRWMNWGLLPMAEGQDASEEYTSEVHAFDITDPRQARYVASGEVRGHLLNQWSMSEHEGYLRVATTEGSPWWPAEEGRPVSQSYVTVLEQQGGELAQVGQAGGLGPDERIYAVRFMGDVGYVVTFRETDPLYTLDLSDPADPRAVGELKILGYSAYLHPLGDGLLLGVGQDADEQGMTKGTKLSLFDVSDPAAPARLHQLTLEDGQSEVEWDHRAFLHWPATGLVVVPFQTWRWDVETSTDESTSGALGVTADRASGFTEVGRVTHVPADLAQEDPRRHDYVWQAQIRRSLVVGDRLLTVSPLGVKSSALDTLADVGWLRLPPPRSR